MAKDKTSKSKGAPAPKSEHKAAPKAAPKAAKKGK